MTHDIEPEVVTFADMGLRAELLTELTSLGYEEPTPIQAEAVPILIAGHDLLGTAATGTGKTAAFALPLLQRMQDQRHSARHGDAPVALVLVPTRELAMQVSEAVYRYGRGMGVRVLPIFGGQPIHRQLQALGRGVDVVVATPGRAIDHLKRGTLPLDEVRTVVLDEADEMLDMGFSEDIETLLGQVPDERQTVLFSATMPSRINGLAKRHLRDPERIRIEREVGDSAETPLVRQRAFIVPRSHKPAALGRILDVEAPTAAIVFCRTRNEVDALTETMNGRGYRAEGLHGGMSQDQRDRVMGRLRNEAADLLVATDVAARGLDIDHLTHVVNYDVPSAPEAYVHRVGRVGRAGREGVAITLAGPREHRLLKNIERQTGHKISIEKVPSVADLHNRRLELTLNLIRDTLDDDDLDRFRAIVENLADDHDPVEIALAAVKLAHEATGGPRDEEEIPDVAKPKDRDRAPRGTGRADGGGGSRHDRKGARSSGAPSEGMSRVFIGAGRGAGIRPKDLVGAIANETKLQGKQIGGIQITENFSLVEVPSGAVDEVVWTLRKSTIKGKKVTVRKDRAENG